MKTILTENLEKRFEKRCKGTISVILLQGTKTIHLSIIVPYMPEYEDNISLDNPSSITGITEEALFQILYNTYERYIYSKYFIS